MARWGTIPLILLLALLAYAGDAHAAFPGANGKIAFSRLVCDTQCGSAIYTVNPDGSDLTRLTGPDVQDEAPTWSADGERLAFTRRKIPDPQNPRDVDSAIYLMDKDGGNVTELTPSDDGVLDFGPGWSPDGQKIAFARADTIASNSCATIYTVNVDGSGLTPVLPSSSSPCKKNDLAWSPNGDLLAFDDDFPGSPTTRTVKPDGTQLQIVFNGGASPDWALSNDRVLFTYNGFVRWRALGTATLGGPAGSNYAEAVWSPDGARFALTQTGCCQWGIYTVDDAGGDLQQVTSPASHSDHHPSWQPVPPLPAQPGYPRPKGATPFSVSLVPAYAACTAPNDTHGAPLSFPSCNPAQQASNALTFGTPDANEARANSIGRVTFKVKEGDPVTPANEADVSVDVSLTDVRCKSNYAQGCPNAYMSDYIGSLRLVFAPNARLTDRFSGGTETEAATLGYYPNYPTPEWPGPVIRIPCATTPDDPSIGSTCAIQTTFNAAVGPVVREGRRAVWQFGQITVYDTGVATPQPSLLATQGVFVP